MNLSPDIATEHALNRMSMLVRIRENQYIISNIICEHNFITTTIVIIVLCLASQKKARKLYAGSRHRNFNQDTLIE